MSNTTINTWKKQSGFILSLLGSCVGFGNILSFSAVCYKNGGGAFLIPYFVALLVLGIPMLFLEGVIGYKWKLPLASAYGHVAGRMGRTFGWLAVIACTTIGSFYIVLTGYSLAYAYFAGAALIPQDTAHFFKESFLHVSGSLQEWGAFSWSVFLATAIAAIYSWVVLVRNVQDGIEKICSFFMPFLAAIMCTFVVTATLLPGGIMGWYYYLVPDFSKLFDPLLWRDVFGQLLFSLSLGLGIIVGYSRHTGQKIDIGKSMVLVAAGDFFISFIAGAAIFACMAHMSTVSGVSFDAIIGNASTFEIGFVIFPKILACFSPWLAVTMGVIFFFCLFLKGAAGVFSIVESVAGNVEQEFGFSRKKAVTLSLGVIVALSLFFCMGNALHLIDALASMVLGVNMLVGSLLLITVFLLSSSEIQNDPIWRGRVRRFFLRSLCSVVPIILMIILGGNVWHDLENWTMTTAVSWSWFVAACLLAYVASRYAEKKKALRTSSV